jgi:predicted ester cyclase
METEGNKEKVRRLYEEGVNQGQRAVVDEVFASDIVLRGPVFGTGELRGSDAITAIKREFALYNRGEGTFTIQEQIAEGESVATRYTLSYTYTADEPTLPGEHIESSGVTFCRFANGRIRNYFVVARNVQLVEERRVAHN